MLENGRVQISGCMQEGALTASLTSLCQHVVEALLAGRLSVAGLADCHQEEHRAEDALSQRA